MIKKAPTAEQKYWLMLGDTYSPGFQMGEVEEVEYEDEDALLPNGVKLKTGHEWTPYEGYFALDGAGFQSFEDEYNDGGHREYIEFYAEVSPIMRQIIPAIFRNYDE